MIGKMKKVLFIIVFCIASLNTFAQNVIKYTSANLNMRSQPYKQGTVLTVIPKGNPVSIREVYSYNWVEVDYKGLVGYVSAKYLVRQVKKRPAATSHSSDGGVKYYTNSFGERVQSPTYYTSPPAGATALCRDGTYSFSKNRRGTCSHHGGVAKWLN